jgi:D-alanyl-lipoteichoic acid acyltransferase DltB (MBOAT superfamily)
MVFNSIIFLVFLAVVLLLYYRLGFRAQNWMLVGASYLFYGWWDYRFVGLLLFTTVFDYFCALWIERESRTSRRRLLLASSMTVNLGVLCIFKYFNFFAGSLQRAFDVFGITLSFPTLHVVLPVGISFYTFLSMSYTIDVYRKELPATRNLLEFMLYVAFFPHLVAGPIVRASFLLPQCQKPRKIIPEEVANGIWLILMGFVKKVVIADRLSQVVAWGFSGGEPRVGNANSWLVIYAFAFQIYGDFSGYSDIARGISKLMGFELVVNFRAPYLVSDPASFWRHWHISLSTWLRDYLYIPLGGNRYGRLKTYRNLGLTMLLGGLWHGAGAAYVLWGLYHGALLAIQRMWKDVTGGRQELQPARTVLEPVLATSGPVTAGVSVGREYSLATRAGLAAGQGRSSGSTGFSPTFQPESDTAGLEEAAPGTGTNWLMLLKRGFLVLVFFHLTCVGWLLFRAGSLPPNVDQVHFVLKYLATMIIPPRGIDSMAQGIFLLGGLALFLQWRHEAMNRFSRWPVHWQAFGVTAALAAIAALGIFEGAQFIYFQF